MEVFFVTVKVQRIYTSGVIHGKATHPKKTTLPKKSNLHKQFAQTLSACFLLILKTAKGEFAQIGTNFIFDFVLCGHKQCVVP